MRIELFGEFFEISRVARVVEAAGLLDHLASRTPFPKHFVRDFPFLYRKVLGYKKLVYFLHVPKTAGSTFTDLVMRANRHAIYKGIFSEHFLEFQEQVHSFIGFDEAVVAGKDVFLCGHYKHGELTRSGIFDKTTDELVVIIRDPKDIVISTYNFIRTTCAADPEGIDAVRWRELFKKDVQNIQFAEWISEEATLDEYFTPYHVIFDIDANADLDRFLCAFYDMNLTVVSMACFNAWVAQSAYVFAEDGGPIPVVSINVSTKYVDNVALQDLLANSEIVKLEREAQIYRSLLKSPFTWGPGTQTLAAPESVPAPPAPGIAGFIAQHLRPASLLGTGAAQLIADFSLPDVEIFCVEKSEIMAAQPAPPQLDQKFDLVLALADSTSMGREEMDAAIHFLSARAGGHALFLMRGEPADIEQGWEACERTWRANGMVVDARLGAIARPYCVGAPYTPFVLRLDATDAAMPDFDVEVCRIAREMPSPTPRPFATSLLYDTARSALGVMPSATLRIERRNVIELAGRCQRVLAIGLDEALGCLLYLRANARPRLTVIGVSEEDAASPRWTLIQSRFADQLTLFAGDLRTGLTALNGSLFDMIHVNCSAAALASFKLADLQQFAAADHVLVIDGASGELPSLKFAPFARLNAALAAQDMPQRIGRFPSDVGRTASVLSRLKAIYQKDPVQSSFIARDAGGVPLVHGRSRALLSIFDAIEDRHLAGAIVESGAGNAETSVLAVLSMTRFLPRDIWLLPTQGASAFEAARHRLFQAGADARQVYVSDARTAGGTFAIGAISLLVISGDNPESARKALALFYGQIVQGGWIVIEAYGANRYVREAVDLFFARQGERFIGQALDIHWYAHCKTMKGLDQRA